PHFPSAHSIFLDNSRTPLSPSQNLPTARPHFTMVYISHFDQEEDRREARWREAMRREPELRENRQREEELREAMRREARRREARRREAELREARRLEARRTEAGRRMQLREPRLDADRDWNLEARLEEAEELAAQLQGDPDALEQELAQQHGVALMYTYDPGDDGKPPPPTPPTPLTSVPPVPPAPSPPPPSSPPPSPRLPPPPPPSPALRPSIRMSPRGGPCACSTACPASPTLPPPAAVFSSTIPSIQALHLGRGGGGLVRQGQGHVGWAREWAGATRVAGGLAAAVESGWDGVDGVDVLALSPVLPLRRLIPFAMPRYDTASTSISERWIVVAGLGGPREGERDPADRRQDAIRRFDAFVRARLHQMHMVQFWDSQTERRLDVAFEVARIMEDLRDDPEALALFDRARQQLFTLEMNDLVERMNKRLVMRLCTLAGALRSRGGPR
ncbi:hypothetical protein EDC01DRAFT_754487, partial [Geopyxis carbonaria]